MSAPGGASPARIAAAAAVLALGAGCAALPGGLFTRLPAEQRPAELVPIKQTVSIRVLWQASAGPAGTAVFSPAIDAAQVYTAAADGTLSAWELASGRLVWRVQALRPASGGVGAGDGLIVIGGPDGEVEAWTAAGKLAWKAQVSSAVHASPLVSQGMVVVRSGDARLWGFDATTGERRWVYQRAAAPPLSVRSHAGLIGAHGSVIAGFAGGRLVALDLRSGGVLLDVAVAIPRGATELERVADITSPPVADDRQLCAVAYRGRLACFEIPRGTLAWARDLSSLAGLDFDRRAVYSVDAASVVHALDRDGGASLWRQAGLRLRGVGMPRVIAGVVAVGDREGFVHLLAPEDGSFVGRVSTDGSAIAGVPAVFPGGLVVQTRAGGVYALGIGR